LTDNEQAFLSLALPYAQRVRQQLGLPVSAVLAQWAIESSWGTSDLARYHHNLGGISFTRYADYAASNKPAAEGGGPYSGFRSLEAFTADYIRLLSARGYGYPAILEAGRRGDPVAVIDAMAASQYASSHYQTRDEATGRTTLENMHLIQQQLARFDADITFYRRTPEFTIEAGPGRAEILPSSPVSPSAWAAIAGGVLMILALFSAGIEYITKEE
jgi:hypothetical protein